MTDYIVNALGLVQLCLDIIVVCAVLQQKFHVVKVAVVVRKLFGQVKAVGVHMAIIGQRVVILRVGALPGERHIVGIAGIAIDHGSIAVHGAGIGDSHGQVAVAPEQAGGGIIDRGGGVDLLKTICGHGNGHLRTRLGAIVRVAGSELAVLLRPNRHPIRAGNIPEELNLHVVFVVLNALRKIVHKGISGQRSGRGCDGGQCGGHLVLHHVAVRSGGGVIVSISDVVGLASILTRICFGFSNGFLQRGVASLILGIERQIIVPLAAVHCGHGQRNKEGGCGGGDVLRHAGFHQQVKALSKTVHFGVAVLVRFRHSGAAVGRHVFLQSILGAGGIGGQGMIQRLD